jgi:hypothetical protein
MLIIPRRQRLDPKPFRFMDLPVEIRLQVAKYVIRNDASLGWKWVTQKNNKRVGKFTGMRSVNPLGLVSRQLYADTWGIMWKVNTVNFIGSRVGLNLYNGRTSFTEVYAFFLRKIGPKAATLLRSIVFSTVLAVDTTFDLKRLLDWFIPLTKQTPAAQIRLCDTAWYEWGTAFRAAEDVVSDFMDKGYKCQSAFAELGHEKKEARNWTIMPAGGLRTSEPDWATDVLDEAELATLMDWLANGL